MEMRVRACVCSQVHFNLDLWLIYAATNPFWDVLLLFLGQNVHAYS